ncbi:MAG TPA: VTT domain-containing protein [Vicinamibacterales bacterium]|nr:VTT domain-containing protein [Vicinamibacterales bacterium]
MNHRQLRRTLGIVWMAGVALALYMVLFHRGVILTRLQAATTSSLVVGGALYLLLGCLRGFTLIPATSLVAVGMLFFPPGLLFVLTLAGVLVSSASIYYFAEALHLDELLRHKHAGRLHRVRDLLNRYGLPMIAAWAFFPLAPTDLICYLAGVLRIRVWICLLGVGIGEGAICAIYIFFGHAALHRS